MRRYGPGARWYDVLSLERPLYRQGRLAMIDFADPRPGDRVLDVGCGTGLNFAPLLSRIGDRGRVVGVDASPAMLAQARSRVADHGWEERVCVQNRDAAQLDDSLGRFDIVLFGYSLAIVGDWPRAWTLALERVAAGGRVGVVDTALPTGRWRWLRWPAALFLRAGDVHPGREVWQLVERDLDQVRTATLKGGHVHVAVGVKR